MNLFNNDVKEGFRKLLEYSLEKTKTNIEEEQKNYEKKIGKIEKSRKISINKYIEVFKNNYNIIIEDFFQKNSKLIKNKKKIVITMFVFSDKYEQLKIKQAIGRRNRGGITLGDVEGSLHLVSINNPESWGLNNCFYFQLSEEKTVGIESKKKEKGLQHNLLCTNKMKNEYFIGFGGDKEYLSDPYISRILWYNEIKIPEKNFQINIYVTEKKIMGLKYEDYLISVRRKNVLWRLQKQKIKQIANEINKFSSCYSNYGTDKRKYITENNWVYELDSKGKNIRKERVYKSRIERKCECHGNTENREKCNQKVKEIYFNNFCKKGKKYDYSDKFLTTRDSLYDSPQLKNKRRVSCEEKSDVVLFYERDYPLKITEEEINNAITCKKTQSKSNKILTSLVKPLSNTRNFLIRIKSISLIVNIGLFLYKNKDKIINIVTVAKPLISWWLIDDEDRKKEIEKRIANTKAYFRMNEMVSNVVKNTDKTAKYITNAMYAKLIHEIYKKTLEKKKELHIIISSKNLVKVNEMINNALINNKVIIYFSLEDFKSIDVILKIIRLYIKQNIKAVVGDISFLEKNKKVKNLTNVPLPLILSKTYKNDGKTKFNFSVGKDKI